MSKIDAVTRTINDVIGMTWPMILVSTIIVISIRICYLIKENKHFYLYKELFMLAMIIYVLMLFQIVTSQDVVSFSTNNFIPFKEIIRYKIGSRLFFKNVVGNLILFIPFGFFTSYALKNKEKAKTIVLLTLLASITIECVQLMIGRVFDVDDILLNTVGGYLGFLTYRIVSSIKEKSPEFCKSEWFLNIITIIIILCLIAGLVGVV